MGFESDNIERAIFYGNCDTVESILDYLLKNEQGYWEHKHRSTAQVKGEDKEFCYFCE